MPENQSYAEQNKARLKDITDSIEAGIEDLFQSDKYKQYLSTMSRFHKYSVNNTMLIYMQKPDATVCAGFNKWRDQFERNVLKGEKGIKIIAPTPYKKKIEQEKLDPDTKLPMLDEDGNAIIEEKTIQIPMYKVVSVFDVAQTEGKPLPELAENLTGNVQNYDVFMEALKRSAPVPIAFEPMQPDMDGYFNTKDQSIAIREGMSEVQTVSAAVHEIAHSKLHNKELPEVKEQWKLIMVSDVGVKKDLTVGFDSEAETLAEGDSHAWRYVDENGFEWHLEVDEDTFTADFVKKSRETEEVEAESVSFAVCAYYGIQTGENSFGYIATWSKDKELSALRESLETINKTSSALITDIDRNYRDIMKERGLDKAEPEQVAPTVEYLMHTNPRTTGESDRCFVQAYTQQDGELIPGEIIGIGTAEKCRELSEALNKGGMTADEARVALLDKPPASVNEKAEPTYPMPDPTLTIEDMHRYGYTDGDMLPVTADRAVELMEQDVTIYGLKRGDRFVRTADIWEVITYEGMLGVNTEAWAETWATLPPSKFQPGYEERSEPTTAENVPETPDAPSDDVAAYLPDEAPLGGGRIVDMQVETYDPNVKPAYPADYPMPDPTISIESMNAYGYTDGDMLPLTKERAMELFERDISVYMLYEGNGSGMAFDTEDIEMHSGIFGVTVEEWEEVKDSVPVMEADPAEQQKRLEASFLENEHDSFAIYQLKRGDETTELRFMNSDYLKKHDLEPEHGNYDLVYTDVLPQGGDSISKLDGLFYRFNEDRPADFPGHSLSVSDIVALKQSGVVSCHYVDSFGFKELPTFLPRQNYLKNAEMAMEDDYNQIDGIVNNGPKQLTVAELEQQAKSGQPISLMDLMEAGRREKQQERPAQQKARLEKRPSVLAMLKTPLDPSKAKKAPVKSAEREM